MKARFVIYKKKVLEQYEAVNALADIVSYSSKTNQDVTKILEKETDSMFSVHFENELKHVKDFSRVIFLAQAWTSKEIDGLIKQGIDWFVVDNETDLDVLLAYLKDSDKKVNLLLRLKLKELTLRTERYFVFGMPSDVINKRIRELRNNKNIAKLGIHFHRKTQNMSEWELKHDIEEVIENNVLEIIDWLNIGGGLPSEYANTNMKVLPGIFKKIQDFREWLKQYNIKMMIEPGRFIAAPAGKLKTRIIAIHGNNIIVNASVYNTDMDAMLVPVKLKIQGELKQGTPYVVKGITPCSMDLFRYRAYLNKPKVGDELVFLNAGAYNFSTDFCDLKKLETVLN
ncbi:decarboxylase [Nanoarchaeota archaeon]